MTARRLLVSEWARVEPLFQEAFNEPMPSPTNSQIVVLEHDGEIAGFATAQVVLHIEPIWVAPKYRAVPTAISTLVSKMQELYCSFPLAFSHTQIDSVARLLKRLGFEEVPAKLFRWIRK